MKTMFSVALLLLFSYSNPNDTKPSLTDAEELRIGEVLAKDFERQEGMQSTPQSIKIDAYLQAVGDKVVANAQRKLPYRFHFDPSPTFHSAVALPGGQIYVGAGILAYIDSEDQLATVLGHEVEHVALNQCKDRLAKVLSEEHLSVNDADKLKVERFLENYGHDNEFAADREGVLLAMKAGYSANAAVRLLRTFILLGEQMPETPSESKRSLEARIEQIRAVRKSSNLPESAKETALALP